MILVWSHQDGDWVRVVWRGDGPEAAGGGVRAQQEYIQAKKRVFRTMFTSFLKVRRASLPFSSVLQIRIRIRIRRIHVFLVLPDPNPDPLVRDMDPDPSVVEQK